MPKPNQTLTTEVKSFNKKKHIVSILIPGDCAAAGCWCVQPVLSLVSQLSLIISCTAELKHWGMTEEIFYWVRTVFKHFIKITDTQMCHILWLLREILAVCTNYPDQGLFWLRCQHTTTHTHTHLHVCLQTHTHILPGGSELPLYGPSPHMLISINHPTKQMSGTKERSLGLWGPRGRRRRRRGLLGEGGRRGEEEQKAGRMAGRQEE